ncbi:MULTISPECIES: hypothetical protein [Faecalibacterium]|uniref:hypothetical protein n=1 Tax=Faecalibacterium TaxID=216851 RepID=UPI001CC0485C|nr:MULTISPECIES: hypothetical protein [Faecalibacterium]
MRYYKLSETPAYYITAWYNLLSGKWEFGKVHATETTVEGTTVELNTNGHHATYEMKISGFDLDYKANKVYGVVLTTADGSEYGLHHVTNLLNLLQHNLEVYVMYFGNKGIQQRPFTLYHFLSNSNALSIGTQSAYRSGQRNSL